MIRPVPKPAPRVKVRKPLSAKHWGVRTRRKAPRRSGRAIDRDYLEAVRALPCMMQSPIGWPCSTRTEAHHADVDHGLGAKGTDYGAVPLCRRCHREWTDHAGLFKGMTKFERRTMAARWISATQARLLHAPPVGDS